MEEQEHEHLAAEVEARFEFEPYVDRHVYRSRAFLPLSFQTRHRTGEQENSSLASPAQVPFQIKSPTSPLSLFPLASALTASGNAFETDHEPARVAHADAMKYVISPPARDSDSLPLSASCKRSTASTLASSNQAPPPPGTTKYAPAPVSSSPLTPRAVQRLGLHLRRRSPSPAHRRRRDHHLLPVRPSRRLRKERPLTPGAGTAKS